MNTTRQTTTQTQNPLWLQPWTLSPVHIQQPAGAYWLNTLVRQFAPISLKEMDSVTLLNRTDTKFVLTRGQFLQALAAVQADYRILSVRGNRLNHYRTLYFDTPDFSLYNLHVNERAERYKVRSREYLDSGLAFLEVKHKTRKDRTIKERTCTGQQVTELSDASEDWLADIYPYDSRALEPKLWNTFTRITLVNRERCERVTLDVDLAFLTHTRSTRLDGLVVAEVKMDSADQYSPFMAHMRAQHIRPQGFSKYCIGVALLSPQVKKNTLKPKLLWIDKMMKGNVFYE